MQVCIHMYKNMLGEKAVDQQPACHLYWGTRGPGCHGELTLLSFFIALEPRVE